MKELKDYTDEELREELKRRAIEKEKENATRISIKHSLCGDTLFLDREHHTITGREFEYLPCLTEPPYIDLLDFKEFKKIMCRGREKPKPTLIFKERELKRFEHLVNDAVKREYDIVSENGKVKFIPKKK